MNHICSDEQMGFDLIWFHDGRLRSMRAVNMHEAQLLQFTELHFDSGISSGWSDV